MFEIFKEEELHGERKRKGKNIKGEKAHFQESLKHMGQTDLFISRKNKNGTWKKPINLGAPINTENFDGSIVVNAKGTQGFLASDRTDSKGGLDIYRFDIYPAIAPVPTLCVKGFLQLAGCSIDF